MGSLSVEQASIETITSTISNLEQRLLRISNEKTLKYQYSAAQTSEITFLKDAQVADIKARYGYVEDSSTSGGLSSSEFTKMLAEIESVENDCELQLDQISDQMKIAEERLETQRVEVETQLEAQRASLETWKEARDKTTESCKYFTD